MSAFISPLKIGRSALVCVGILFFVGALSAADPTAPGSRGATRDGDETPVAKAPDKPGLRRALLVGINGYQFMPRLCYCVSDIEAMREKLVASGGYEQDNVFMLTDGDSKANYLAPTSGNIYNTLAKICDDAQPEDSILVAFSGHGVLDDQGRTYLMPSDAAANTLEHTGLSVKAVEDLLAGEKCKARQKILIIDACHAGGKGATTSFDPGRLPEVPKGKGFIRLLACDAGEVSNEDPKLKHGVFSYFLINALTDAEADANHDGYVSVDEARTYVDRHLRDYFRANPEFRGKTQTPLMRGDVSGDIILARVPTNLSQPTPRRAAPETQPADIALLTLPELNGDWWFDQTPWLQPTLRGEIGQLMPRGQMVAKPVNGKLPKRTDGIYDPDTTTVVAGLQKLFVAVKEASPPGRHMLLGRLAKLPLEVERQDSLLKSAEEAGDLYLLALLQHKFDRPQAPETYEKAYADFSQQLNSEDSPRLRALCAMCCLDFATWQLRKKNNEQALDWCGKARYTLKEEDDVPLFRLALMCTAADACRQSAQFANAIRILKKASELAAERLDDRHPLVANIHERMAWTLLDQWEIDEAQTHFQQALALEREILKQHPDRASTALAIWHDEHGLALAARFAGKTQEAIAQYSKLLETFNQGDGTLDSDHATRVVNTTERLADVDLALGGARTRAASRLLGDAIRELKYQPTEDRDMLEIRLRCKRAIALAVLASDAQAQVDLEAADRLLKKLGPLGLATEGRFYHEIAQAIVKLQAPDEAGRKEGRRALRELLHNRIQPAAVQTAAAEPAPPANGAAAAPLTAAPLAAAAPQQRETLEFALFAWNKLVSSELADGHGAAPDEQLLSDSDLVFDLVPEQFLHPAVLGFLKPYYELAIQTELAARPPRDPDDLARHVHLVQCGTCRAIVQFLRPTVIFYLAAAGEGCALVYDPDADPKTFALPYGRQELEQAVQSKKELALPPELAAELKHFAQPPHVVWDYGGTPPTGLPPHAEISATWETSHPDNGADAKP